MALADIQAKIAQDARAEAEAILAQAEEQAGRIRCRVEAEINSIREGFEERAALEEKEVFRRRDVVRRVDERKIELNGKRRLLDRVFGDAVSVLSKLPEAEYRTLAERLLTEAAPKGDEILILAEGETRLGTDWLQKMNERTGAKLSTAPTREPFAGGFCLQSGRIRIDASLETLVEQTRETLEGDVVKRLFSR